MDTRIVNACFYPSRLLLLTCHIFIDLLLIDQQPICNYIGLTYKFNVQVTKPKSVVIILDARQVIDSTIKCSKETTDILHCVNSKMKY